MVNRSLHRYTIAFLGILLCAIASGRAIAQEPDEPRNAPRMSPAEYTQKLQLAEAYEEKRDAQSAARIYGELYTLNPSDETVFEGYTRTLFILKQYDDAERIVNERLKHDASLDVLLLSARLEARMNKRPQALDAFQKAERAVNAKDCASLFPIVYAMMDVSYNQDALQLLDEMRKMSSDDEDVCSSQIAGLYLRLGDFDRAAKEFIAILKSGEGNVGMVEQRLAQYITDSLSRTTILSSVEREVNAVPPTRANLRLLAWLYGEKKDYRKALETIIKLDNVAADESGAKNNEGPELLQFADRARSEGALDVAARAYTEAITRLKSSDYRGQVYYIAQAELGALKTWEKYYLTAGLKDSLPALISKYEAFAQNAPANEFVLDALVHAANLSFNELFDLPRATKDFETALARASGLSDVSSQAMFGLVDIAYASRDFNQAQARIAQIEKMLSRYRSVNEREIRNHITFERALGQYYQMNFDSAQVLLQTVAADSASDYANDAIQLSGIIQESNNPRGLPSLKLFAHGALAETAHKFEEAERDYRTIVDSETNAPLADDAVLRQAAMLVKLGKPEDAVRALDAMQEKMLTSPLLDVAGIREAEIVERNIHDKARAQKMYEDFLARYPNSNFVDEARDRARKLRGDAF